MTTPTWYLALVAILGVLLVAVSAVAGCLWARLRSLPSQTGLAQLARELAERQRALEALIDRLEPRSPSSAARTVIPRRQVAVTPDPAAPAAITPEPAIVEGRRYRVDLTTAVESVDARGAEADRLTTDAGLSHSLGPTLITVPDLAALVEADEAAQAAEAAATASELDDRYGSLWALADAGLPPDAIARQTGLPIGQIELILALRRHMPSSPVVRRP